VFPRRITTDRRLLPVLLATAAMWLMHTAAAQQESAAASRAEAMALEQKGMVAEAEQIWDQLAKANSRDAEAFAHLGLLEARQERYENAIVNYRQAMAINGDLPGLQMNLGLALFKAAQFPDAIASFSAELKKHPDDPRLMILLGMAHYGLKDYLVAVPYLRQAADRDPQNASILLTLAQSCLWSKQYQCVVDAYRQMLALHAESAEADLLAAEALDEMQDSAGAEKALRAAILADGNVPNAHFALGYVLWARGAWGEAANEFQEELKIDPQHGKARVYLADSWVRQNEFSKAKTEIETFGDSEKADPIALMDLGSINAHEQRFEDAAGQLIQAADSDPGNAEPHRQLAHLYQSMGKTGEAKRELEKAARMARSKRRSLQEILDSLETPAR
jgi:tetratricopeptide (TPR) repeat protein